MNKDVALTSSPISWLQGKHPGWAEGEYASLRQQNKGRYSVTRHNEKCLEVSRLECGNEREGVIGLTSMVDMALVPYGDLYAMVGVARAKLLLEYSSMAAFQRARMERIEHIDRVLTQLLEKTVKSSGLWLACRISAYGRGKAAYDKWSYRTAVLFDGMEQSVFLYAYPSLTEEGAWEVRLRCNASPSISEEALAAMPEVYAQLTGAIPRAASELGVKLLPAGSVSGLIE